MEAKILGSEIVGQVTNASEKISRYEYGNAQCLGKGLKPRGCVHDIAEVCDFVSLKPDLSPGTWEQDFDSREIRPATAAAAFGE